MRLSGAYYIAGKPISMEFDAYHIATKKPLSTRFKNHLAAKIAPVFGFQSLSGVFELIRLPSKYEANVQVDFLPDLQWRFSMSNDGEFSSFPLSETTQRPVPANLVYIPPKEMIIRISFLNIRLCQLHFTLLQKFQILLFKHIFTNPFNTFF